MEVLKSISVDAASEQVFFFLLHRTGMTSTKSIKRPKRYSLVFTRGEKEHKQKQKKIPSPPFFSSILFVLDTAVHRPRQVRVTWSRDPRETEQRKQWRRPGCLRFWSRRWAVREENFSEQTGSSSLLFPRNLRRMPRRRPEHDTTGFGKYLKDERKINNYTHIPHIRTLFVPESTTDTNSKPADFTEQAFTVNLSFWHVWDVVVQHGSGESIQVYPELLSVALWAFSLSV